MIDTNFLFLIAIFYLIMGWSTMQSILSPSSITLLPFSRFTLEFISFKLFMSLSDLWSLLGSISIDVLPNIAWRSLTLEDIFIRKTRNEVELAYSIFIFLNKKSSSVLGLILLLANLNLQLAKIASILISITQRANDWTNFYKNRSWGRKRLNLRSYPKELANSIWLGNTPAKDA